MNKSETAGGGPLLAEDYRKARKEVSDIVIAPFDENKAKGVGYNLAASMLVYSVNKKRLVKVKENDREVYIEIAPHDTVLTLSHEYLVVDGDIAGTFHSKVRCSAMGLGNVSTTLDPNWRGKLLFSLNNPTKRKIKLVIEEKNDGARKAVGLITMVLYRIAGKEEHITAKELHLDNPPMRTDIWQDLTERPSGIHAQAYVLQDSVIAMLADALVENQKRENTHLPALQEELKRVNKKIDNIAAAIEEGIITQTTKERLTALEAQRDELQISIFEEETSHPKLTKEYVVQWLESFKQRDLRDPKVRRQVIECFVNTVYVFEDKIIVNLNLRDGDKPIALSKETGSDIETFGSPKSSTSQEVIYALSDFLIMILSWLVKQSLRAFLFQEVQL